MLTFRTGRSATQIRPRQGKGGGIEAIKEIQALLVTVLYFATQESRSRFGGT